MFRALSVVSRAAGVLELQYEWVWVVGGQVCVCLLRGWGARRGWQRLWNGTEASLIDVLSCTCLALHSRCASGRAGELELWLGRATWKGRMRWGEMRRGKG
jgi:hypothetical protein